MFEVVNREELIKRLGRQCSPCPRREWYVIGPDVNGRVCHIASCFSKYDAKQIVERHKK